MGVRKLLQRKAIAVDGNINATHQLFETLNDKQIRSNWQELLIVYL